MKHDENIRNLVELQPDYIGFIFYAKSKRFVGEDFNESFVNQIPENIQKVGVFVDADIEYVMQKVEKYKLDLVQLHGKESVDYCKVLKSKNVSITKFFPVSTHFDFSVVNNYKPYCNYFLFDTSTEGYGGSGVKFDWHILEKYDNDIPFFLSGGIDSYDLPKIKSLTNLNIHAIDINSRFEIEAGLKDIQKVKDFIIQLRNNG